MTFYKKLFGTGNQQDEGVPKIKIYLLRLLFTLIFFFLSYDSWSAILKHTGEWNPSKAAAVCMWAAFAMLSFIGIFRPLLLLPLVAFEIIYKLIWLAIVAYPLWSTNQLTGSSAERMTYDFLWVILPIVAMPWKLFINKYILIFSKNNYAI